MVTVPGPKSPSQWESVVVRGTMAGAGDRGKHKAENQLELPQGFQSQSPPPVTGFLSKVAPPKPPQTSIQVLAPVRDNALLNQHKFYKSGISWALWVAGRGTLEITLVSIKFFQDCIKNIKFGLTFLLKRQTVAQNICFQVHESY